MITAPWYRDPVETTAFNAYAYHQQQIDDFVRVLAAADDPNDAETQWEALRQVGLDVNDLSPFDLNYIEKELAKQL